MGETRPSACSRPNCEGLGCRTSLEYCITWDRIISMYPVASKQYCNVLQKKCDYLAMWRTLRIHRMCGQTACFSLGAVLARPCSTELRCGSLNRCGLQSQIGNKRAIFGGNFRSCPQSCLKHGRERRTDPVSMAR